MLNPLHHIVRLHQLGQNDILYHVEHHLDILRIGGTREMRVQFSCALLILVQLQKLFFHKLHGLLGIAHTLIVVVKAHLETHVLDLLLEQILLVEEDGNGRVTEISTVTNLVKQQQGFLHAVHRVVLGQHLIVLAETGDEEDETHLIEHVNPLSALISLTV